MKILVVTNMYPTPERPYSGIYVARQVEALRRSGLSVIVEVVEGHRSRWSYLEERARVRRILRNECPDVVHAHYGYTGLAVFGLGHPYILTLCGDDIYGESDAKGRITALSRLGIVVTKAMAALARDVIVVDANMARHLPLVRHDRIHVVPYAIDESLFTPGPKAEARKRLGIPTHRVALGFVNSGGQPTKNLPLAKAACAELIDRGIDAQLVVMEDVQPSEMPFYYRAVDCLLVTSFSEGSPNCVKEALHCGTPVVTVDVGDARAVIDCPERGRIVLADARAFASAIDDVIRSTSPGEVSLLSQTLTEEVVHRQLIRIYESTLMNR